MNFRSSQIFSQNQKHKIFFFFFSFKFFVFCLKKKMEVHEPTDVKKIMLTLTRLITSDVTSLSQTNESLTLPLIKAREISDVLMKVEAIFKSEPVMLEIASPITVVGDLHGHFLDLIRIFKEYGMPPSRNYLFLGDYVDRGEFSTETVTLLFCLKILYPNNVYLIRGNHEFDALCKNGGFYEELSDIYGNTDLYPKFLEAFSYMPISAIIDKNILCIHGGLGPSLYSTYQLKELKRPINEFEEDSILGSILWSDPKDTCDNYQDSVRGSGYFFGESAFKEFADSQKITTIIRAHECVLSGFQTHFNGRLMTVFSASNYCGLVGNLSAVLMINDGDITPKALMPLGYPTRSKGLKHSASVIRPTASNRSLKKLGVGSLPNTSMPNLFASGSPLAPLSPLTPHSYDRTTQKRSVPSTKKEYARRCSFSAIQIPKAETARRKNSPLIA